jgi:two-component system, NarL family, response regulator NreC
MTTNIMVVDDHAIVLHGLSLLINDEPGLNVSVQASSAEQALELLAKGPLPDLLITDISLPGLSGIELVKSVTSEYPELPVLVLSMHDELVHGERAFRAGAKGYLTKQEATEKVVEAIKRVLSGDVYLSERLLSVLRQPPRGDSDNQLVSVLSIFTDREYEIFRLIGLGMGSSEIAAKLNRSVKTIEAHRANLKQKLGLRTANELNRFAANWADRERI